MGVALRDVLSFVFLQKPRLRQRMRMDSFRQQLLTSLLALYCRHLARETATVDLIEEEEEINSDTLKDNLKEAKTTERKPPAPQTMWCRSPAPPPPPCPASSTPPAPLPALPHRLLPLLLLVAAVPHPTTPDPQELTGHAGEIFVAAGGVGRSMGDWEVGRSDEQDTRLRVRPGYGDIRKISFMIPDYAAILSYSLSLGPSHVSLTLNDSPVPGHILATLLEREQREGTLSFLYQLISLRPCFGAFFSELVETVRQ